MLKQSLQQRLQQKISPQQIQVIKLLEIPLLELEQRIIKEMEENPALVEGEEDALKEDAPLQSEEDSVENNEKDEEEFTMEDFIPDDDDEIPAYKLAVNNNSRDDERREIPYSVAATFYESLLNQLGLRFLTDRQRVLAEFLIGNIEEDGYLRRDIQSLVNDVAFNLNIDTVEEELMEVLEIIRELDPPGVCAFDLRDCLLLQLKRKDPVPGVALAIELIENNFEEFSKKHYDKIVKRLGIEEQDLKPAIEEILRLSPKPGNTMSDAGKNIQSIIPDFVLDYSDGSFQLSLNSRNAPELNISATYSKMLENLEGNKGSKSRGDKQAVNFVRQKLDSAKWFIDAIRQREETLLLTMHAIVKFQEEYFKEGDQAQLRPMILKDIADITGLDISTISRVSNSKYIQTHFGIFPLKYFFSEGMQTDSGEEVSTKEIKMILQECIAVENKKRPLTDDKLSKILNQKGYMIARRTVAKYREQLNIPVGRLRKEI